MPYHTVVGFGRVVYVSVGLAVVLIVLLLAYVIVGLPVYVEDAATTGESYEVTLVPVTPLDAPTSSAPRGFSPGEKLPEGVPPESTLGYRGQVVSSTGELLGVWHRDGLFAGEHHSPFPVSRTEGDLPLSDGGLLSVPRGVKLRFDYGGEVDFGRTVFDVLAFGVEEGELLREDPGGQLMVWDGASPEGGVPSMDRTPRVFGPPFEGPESTGREVRVRMNVPPGVYVVSVSVSARQGDARYNFRVEVTGE